MSTAALIGISAALSPYLNQQSNNLSRYKDAKKLAQYNNQWSEAMMNKQMNYNTMMWEKEAYYNSAQQQAQRLREAGLNPTLVMGGGNAGTVSSGNGVGLPSPSPVNYNPVPLDTASMANALTNMRQQASQEELANANARLINMQADFYSAKTMAEIDELVASADNTKLRNYYQGLQNEFGRGLMSEQYLSEIRRRQSTEVQILNGLKQGMLMDKDIAYYDRRAGGELSEQLSRIALNYGNNTLSLQQAKFQAEQVLSEIEKRYGFKLDNEVKKRTMQSVIEKSENDAWRFGLTELLALGARGLGKGLKWIKDNIF